MPGGNVELARATIGNLSALFDLFDDDIIWDDRDTVLVGHTGVHRGKQAVMDLISGWVGAWADYRFEVDEVIEAGDSVVLVVRETGRGRASGAPMEHRYCQVWTFRNQRIVRGGTYGTKAKALKAVG
jgi:hypothetical protein